jgi:hypothetical protein
MNISSEVEGFTAEQAAEVVAEAERQQLVTIGGNR